MDAIYLDNAATSFPKPAGVSDRMKYYLDCVGANVNRSVYTAAQEAGLVTLTLRQRLARLFDFPEPPTHVILTPGATAAEYDHLRPSASRRPLHRQQHGAQRGHAAAAAPAGGGGQPHSL